MNYKNNKTQIVLFSTERSFCNKYLVEVTDRNVSVVN